MTNDQPNVRIPPPRSCVTGSLIGMSEAGGVLKIVPLFCHRWSCPRCRKTKAYKWRLIAESGLADRFITLTLRASDKLSAQYQAKIIKKAFPRLVEKIRKKWGPMEYMLIFELTKKGTPHIHVLQRGEFIPKSWLSDQWRQLTGSFIVDIRSIRSKADVAKYIMKYMGKAIADVHAKLDGMRIIQRSKNWVIEKPVKKQVSDQAAEDHILSWTFVSIIPAEIIAYVKETHAYNLVPTHDDSCFELRGPPIPELLDYIMDPIITR